MSEPKIALAIHPKFLEKFGFNRLIQWVGGFGIKYLELSQKDPSYFIHIQEALREGFGVTLHLNIEVYLSRWQDDYWMREHFNDLTTAFYMWDGHKKNKIIFILHPVDHADTTVQTNFLTTVGIIKKIQDIIGRESHVQLCVENLPFVRNFSRFGHDFSRLTELVLNCPGIKFVLDVGHYSQSLFRGRPKEIPLEFLNEVAHVHVHDFHPEWGDHLPLGRGIASLDVIKKLKKGIIYCLELHEINKLTSEPKKIEIMLRESILTLKDLLAPYSSS